jgi:hypothetical protein
MLTLRRARSPQACDSSDYGGALRDIPVCSNDEASLVPSHKDDWRCCIDSVRNREKRSRSGIRFVHSIHTGACQIVPVTISCRHYQENQQTLRDASGCPGERDAQAPTSHLEIHSHNRPLQEICDGFKDSNIDERTEQLTP